MNQSALKLLIKEILRSVLKEHLEGKFFWLDPDAKLHQVVGYGHWYWGSVYLTKIKKLPPETAEKDVYGNMFKLGFVRVSIIMVEGLRTLEYEYAKSKQPNSRQLKEIKDLSIEEQVSVLTPHVVPI